LIAGPLTQNLGWKWLFNILQIFLCTLIVIVYFLCPETTYKRDHRYDIDQLRDDRLQDLAATEAKAREAYVQTSDQRSDVEKATSVVGEGRIRAVPNKKTYWKSLAIYTGIYSHDNLIKLIIAPFVTLLNTAALYTCVTSGMLQAWYVGTAIAQAELFSAPPYLLDATQLGFLSVGPLIGGALGSLLIAILSDPVAKWATKSNKGIL
jgi:hypothetical protein